MDNPLGTYKNSEARFTEMKRLAQITGNYPEVEKWIKYGGAFNDVRLFHIDLENRKQMDFYKARAQIASKKGKEAKKRETKKYDFFEDYLQFTEKKGNKTGAKHLRAMKDLYGRDQAIRLILQVGHAAQTLGVSFTSEFMERKGQLKKHKKYKTYYGLMKYLQGVVT